VVGNTLDGRLVGYVKVMSCISLARIKTNRQTCFFLRFADRASQYNLSN